MKILPQPSTNDPFASFREFFRLESTGGMLLFGAAVLAMVFKNTPMADLYAHFLLLPVQVRAGDLDINKSLVFWVNDGLMAVFFLLVTLEIKREMLVGHLSNRSSLVLPAVAAAGGMIVPALLYILINRGDAEAMLGWAIPTTTDIAFALGVLALFGSRVPAALKVLLMTLAVLDDLAAIGIIAVFYSHQLSVGSLVLAGIAALGLVTLNRRGVLNIAPYVWLGVILWVAVLKSGVHATLAGVVLGFAIPLGDRHADHESPLKHLIHALHPWVAFLILPLFAFMNAGIAFEDFDPEKLLRTVPVGIAVGLAIGKPMGVFVFLWLAVKCGLARLPEAVTWKQILGIAFLCGIGFTMSLFLGALAFQEGGSGYARADRLGIILGSLVSGIVGCLILHAALPRVALSEETPSALM